MKKNYFFISLFIAAKAVTINAQNIAVNTTGAPAAATNMFEITQTSTTANTVGLYTTHTGAISGTGYGLYSTKTGASTTNIGGYFNASGGTNNYAIIVPASGGNVGIGTSAPTGLLHVTQTAAATGALTGIVYTGAVNTNQTLSTEIPSVTITTAGRQWATGALTTQREVLITQPVYSFVGGSTITNAATLGIAGAPVKSTNATITNTHGILIQAGAVSTATNSFGLTVNAQTGATSNYAAQFLGGNVGIGTSSPNYLLHVTGNTAATSITYSSASSASSIGVEGENTTVSGTSAGGHGVQGTTKQGTGAGSLGSAGVIGYNSHAAGIGVAGVGNNLSTFVQPNPTGSGCGGMFYGTRYGLFATIPTNNSAGSGYSDGQTYSAIDATSATTSASTTLYNFAIHGYSSCNGSAGRVGAIIGYRASGDWGSLGYFSSGSTSYAAYFVSSLYGTNVFKAGAPTPNPAHIGIGVCGDLMGGWIRGNMYGIVAKGERYGAYVDGKTYTNNFIAQLNDNGSNSERTVSYVPTSTSVDVYTKGTAILSEGRSFVKFDDNYRKLISSETSPIITVTPMGQSNGVYIESVSERGFMVVENNNGTSNVRFSWIAITTKKGCERIETPAELLDPDYDANMNDVMFNDNKKDANAKPIWWDGKKLRFDKPIVTDYKF